MHQVIPISLAITPLSGERKVPFLHMEGGEKMDLDRAKEEITDHPLF